MVDSISLRVAAMATRQPSDFNAPGARMAGALAGSAAGAADLAIPSGRIAFARPYAAVAGAEPAQIDVASVTLGLSEKAPVDDARVASLREAVRSGGYALDSGRTAEAMLRSLKG